MPDQGFIPGSSDPTSEKNRPGTLHVPGVLIAESFEQLFFLNSRSQHYDAKGQSASERDIPVRRHKRVRRNCRNKGHIEWMPHPTVGA